MIQIESYIVLKDKIRRSGQEKREGGLQRYVEGSGTQDIVSKNNFKVRFPSSWIHQSLVFQSILYFCLCKLE